MWMGLHFVQIEGRDLLTLPARAFMTRLKINWRFGPYQTAPRARLAKSHWLVYALSRSRRFFLL